MGDFVKFLGYYDDRIIHELIQHLMIVLASIPLSIIISVPLGLFISSRPKAAKVALYIAGILMTIPSLALFSIMLVVLSPFNLGIGKTPAVMAIIVYSFMPILRNTYIAINNVEPGIIDAAVGMGFSKKQVLLRIKLPMAIPVIMAGVRNAIVLGISVATFAALVGAGGLGYFIFSGINRSNIMMVLTGSVIVSILGISVNAGLIWLENAITPKGLKIK